MPAKNTVFLANRELGGGSAQMSNSNKSDASATSEPLANYQI